MIEVELSTKPIFIPSYWMAPIEHKELSTQLQGLLDLGFIQLSVSPCITLILFMEKKDETFCLCIDYQQLNKVMVKNCYPLPCINSLLGQLQEQQYFLRLIRDLGFT